MYPSKLIAVKRPALRALYLLSASLLLTFSCTKPEQEVGLELQPEEDLLHVMVTDTVTISAATVDEDSLRSDELSLSLAGQYNDPELGAVTASLYTHVRLSTNNVYFGDPKYILVDSLVLSLIYDGEPYGNLTDQEWGVYELTENLYVDSVYFTNSLLGCSPLNLVKPGFTVQPILPDQYIPFGEDSLPPQLRLRLREDLGERFVEAAAGGTDLANNTNFLSFFKGLHVRSLSSDAGILRFNLLDPLSRLTLYYSDLLSGESREFQFNINSDCARFNAFSFEYGGTAFSEIGNSEVPGDLFTAIQAGSGVKTRLRFPNLLDYNQIEGRTINRAELILPVHPASLGNFDPQSLLFALTKDENGVAIATPDQIEGASHIGGYYDETAGEYRFNISRFIQEILNGSVASGDLYLVSNNASVSVNRVILNGPNASEDNPLENMRLRITFSN